MNIHLPVHMDKSAFQSWVQGHEGRYELDRGRVMMMVGASRAHALIVANLLVALREQLDARRWTVFADFGLDAGPETLRYPDIVVDRSGGGSNDLTATAPVLLAEVLSPSTATTDLGDKAAEYRQLPDLVAYLVLAEDGCKAWLWARQGNQLTSDPTIIVGSDEIIRIDPLNLKLPLAALYAGVDLS